MRGYVNRRVADREWNAHPFSRGLLTLPKRISQAHRWNLFRLHLNGHLTTSRLARAGVVQEYDRCQFCNAESDSVNHLAQCRVTRMAWEQLRRNLDWLTGVFSLDVYPLEVVPSFLGVSGRQRCAHAMGARLPA